MMKIHCTAQPCGRHHNVFEQIQGQHAVPARPLLAPCNSCGLLPLEKDTGVQHAAQSDFAAARC